MNDEIPDNLARIYIQKVLSGNVRSFFIDQINKERLPRGRVIKDIWSHFILDEIVKMAPNMKFILIIRHPDHVFNSFIGKGWSSKTLNLSDDLIKGNPNLTKISELDVTSFRDRWFKNWLLENHYAMLALQNSDARVVFYENLKKSPESQFSLILEFLDTQTKNITDCRRPSATGTTGMRGFEILNSSEGGKESFLNYQISQKLSWLDSYTGNGLDDTELKSPFDCLEGKNEY